MDPDSQDSLFNDMDPDDSLFTNMDLDLQPGFDPFEGFSEIPEMSLVPENPPVPAKSLVPEKRPRETDDDCNADDSALAKKSKTGAEYASPYCPEQTEQPVPFLSVLPDQVEISSRDYQSKMKALKFRADRATSERNRLREFLSKCTNEEDGSIEVKNLLQENASLRRVSSTRKAQLDNALMQLNQVQSQCNQWMAVYNEVGERHNNLLMHYGMKNNEVQRLNAQLMAVLPRASASPPASAPLPAPVRRPVSRMSPATRQQLASVPRPASTLPPNSRQPPASAPRPAPRVPAPNLLSPEATASLLRFIATTSPSAVAVQTPAAPTPVPFHPALLNAGPGPTPPPTSAVVQSPAAPTPVPFHTALLNARPVPTPSPNSVVVQTPAAPTPVPFNPAFLNTTPAPTPSTFDANDHTDFTHSFADHADSNYLAAVPQGSNEVIDLTNDTAAPVSTQGSNAIQAEAGVAKTNTLTQFYKNIRNKQMNWLHNTETADAASDRMFRRLNPKSKGGANINVGVADCLKMVATQDMIRAQLGGHFKKTVTSNNYYLRSPTDDMPTAPQIPQMGHDDDSTDEDAPYEMDEASTLQACHTDALVNVHEHGSGDGYDDDELLRLMEEELSR